jgi:diacylglycerol kinase family enzyme
VTYRDRSGAQRTRRFVNVAQVGYGAELLRRAAHWPRALGRVRYLLGAYGAMLTAPRPETAVEVAHTTTTVPVVDVVVANAQFFAGGMKVAPRALPDDGKLNVLVFTGGRAQVFTAGPAIARGEHLPDPQITEYQSPTVRLDPPRALPVEADGQVLGRTPVSFSLLPRALRLKI